jgi:hypothetical protein
MWHEARRRERATQKLFSDHKKRAEKRREENRVDPSSLLQVNGVKSKVSIDANTHKLAANSMVLWQGDNKTTIDRFDVRATLSSIPTEDKPHKQQNDQEKRRRPTILDANENEYMKKLLNFERYRLVIQNELNKVPEATRLSLLDRNNNLLSEAKMRKLKNNWFGTSGETSSVPSANPANSNNNRSLTARSQGVSIGYDYSVGNSNEDLSAPMNATNVPSVLDLDDCDEELDLDQVDKLRSNASDTFELLNRYGLNCDEFDILVDSTSFSAKEIIYKLKQVKKEVKRVCDVDRVSDTTKQKGFYGPSLPPDMQKRENNSLSDRTFRAVSPRGVDSSSKTQEMISSRNISPEAKADKNVQSQQTKNLSPTTTKPRHFETLEESTRNISSSNPSSSSGSRQPVFIESATQKSRLTPIQINLKANRDEAEEKSCKPCEPEDTIPRARRAVTPLAYKRYHRSSRSMSRERTHSSRRRSRSSSSSSDTARSFTSSSSSRSGSSYGRRSRSRSRRRTRRRRRMDSRSPYRGSSRSRHKYRRRERR